MSRKLFVGGNHKMCGTQASLQTILDGLAAGNLPADVDVVIAPPAIYTQYAIAKKPANVEVAVQNCYKEKQGAFTGQTAAAMIKDVGAKWVILGHSECRWVFNETDELIAAKTVHALAEGVGVIFCIGEKLEEREGGTTKTVCYKQLQALLDAGVKDWSNIVVAYEPVWAIGTGKTATPEIAEETHVWIREWLKEKVSPDVAAKIRIIYGGSVTKDNCKTLGKSPNIDGFLVGGASLKPDFIDICKARV